MNSSKSKRNIYGFSRTELVRWLTDNNHSAFRAKQIFSWLYQRHSQTFDEMANIGGKLIEWLNQNAELGLPKMIFDHISDDGTVKFIFRLFDGNAIETVFIPSDKRGTLCLSSQVGCALKCSFCLTGQHGFNRNLSTDEIIGQYIQVRNYLNEKAIDLTISNIVYMGMGEPLLNEDAVFNSSSIFLDDLAMGLSSRRVTISTSGIIPAIRRMKDITNASLTISLHAPNDELRNVLVPINKKYPLKSLIDECKSFYGIQKNRKVSFAYVMLKSINDQPEHARQLITLLSNLSCKVNLIPFNIIPNVDYETSTMKTIKTFQKILASAGITTTIRTTRGDDVTGACGQLKGKVNPRVKKSQMTHLAQQSTAD